MKYTALLEALSLRQMRYVDSKLGGKKYEPYYSHSELFESYPSRYHRITIPFNPDAHIAVDKTIRGHLARHGYNVHDYITGLASRQYVDGQGNERLQIKKIGKILQETGADNIQHPIFKKNHETGQYNIPQSILEFYNNDPVRNSKSDTNIVISRGKEDIAGMSSGRTWEGDSCMRLPYSDSTDRKCQVEGSMHHKIKEDFKHDTLVAYATRKGDDYVEKPIGRVAIKKYISNEKVNGKHHIIYRAESRAYGNPPDGFIQQVNSIMEQHYPAHPNTTYRLHPDLYDDTKQVFENRHGLIANSFGHSNYVNGKLHDFVDENGQHQPAERYKDSFWHYNNGVLHNPHGVAQRENGIESRYINGELHNEEDKPSQELKGKSDIYSKFKAFHINGMLHRTGDLPALDVIEHNGRYKKIYSKYGFEHRDDNKISSIEHDGIFTVSRRCTWGQLHTNNPNQPSNHIIRHLNGITEIKETHQHGLLHSINGKPSRIEIETKPDGSRSIIKQWHNNGELDNGELPHTITTSANGRVKKEWNRPENSDLPTSIEKSEHGTAISYNREHGIILKMKHANGDTTIKHKNSDGTVSIRKDKSGKVIEALVKRNGQAGIHAFVDTPQGLRIYSHDNYLIHPNKEVSNFRHLSETMSGATSKILIRHGTLHPIEHEKSDIQITHLSNQLNHNGVVPSNMAKIRVQDTLFKLSDHPDFKKLIKPYQ